MSSAKRDGFFEAGHLYDDAEPYKAPELTREFRCVHIVTHPTTGEQIAFGFMRGIGDAARGWGGTGMGAPHWDQYEWRDQGRWDA